MKSRKYRRMIGDVAGRAPTSLRLCFFFFFPHSSNSEMQRSLVRCISCRFTFPRKCISSASRDSSPGRAIDRCIALPAVVVSSRGRKRIEPRAKSCRVSSCFLRRRKVVQESRLGEGAPSGVARTHCLPTLSARPSVSFLLSFFSRARCTELTAETKNAVFMSVERRIKKRRRRRGEKRARISRSSEIFSTRF